MEVDLEELRELPREHEKCHVCGRTVGKLPLHLHIKHELTPDQYYRQYPLAKKKTDEDQKLQSPVRPTEHPVNKKLLGLPWGKDLIDASLGTELKRGEDMPGGWIKVGHRKRTNFNILIANTQFSFGDDGVATVPISQKRFVDVLLTRPGFYLVEEIVRPPAPAPPKAADKPPKAAKEVEETKPMVDDSETESEDTVESMDDDEEEIDDYTLRKTELESLKRADLVQEAKAAGVKASGKSVEIIERILDQEFEDVED